MVCRNASLLLASEFIPARVVLLFAPRHHFDRFVGEYDFRFQKHYGKWRSVLPLRWKNTVRVGLYIVCAPASSSRLQLAEGGLLKYLAKGSVPDNRCDALFEPNGQILDPLEWIAKLTLHIPDHGAQTIRYCAIQMSLAQKQSDALSFQIT